MQEILKEFLLPLLVILSRMFPWVYEKCSFYVVNFELYYVEIYSSTYYIVVDVQLYPRVLLTHIPLYRRDWTDCGPNRNSEIINQVLF